MKSIGHILGACLLLLSFLSCKKEETQAVLLAEENRVGAVLNASTDQIELNKGNAEAVVLKLHFKPADFGYKAALSNTVELAIKGTNFANPREIPLHSGDTLVSFLGTALNAHALALGIPTEEASALELRLKSVVSSAIQPLYSNTVTLTVQPYAAISYVYVPGAYQGWDLATAETLVSPTSNAVYWGIINFPEAGSEFKISLSNANWDNAYGLDVSGKISLSAGANIKAPRAGNLEVSINTNTNAISFGDFSWGLIGDATPGDWTQDTPMQYHNAEGLWKITVDLKVGALKFRKNADWGTNLGITAGAFVAGGDNIQITQAGTYAIIVDTETPKLSLVKK